MATDLHTGPDVDAERATHESAATEPGVAALAKGILDDALNLMRQHVLMFKAEIREEFRQLLMALIPLACALAPLLMGVMMLCFMIVHLIHWETLPAGSMADPAAIPLWGDFGIIAAGLLLFGGILLAIGIYRIKHVHLLSEQTAHALEEDIQWLMNHNRK
jgi:hypothetical protein